MINVVEPLNLAQPDWKGIATSGKDSKSLATKWTNYQKLGFAVKRKARELGIDPDDAAGLLDVEREKTGQNLKQWVLSQPGVKMAKFL